MLTAAVFASRIIRRWGFWWVILGGWLANRFGYPVAFLAPGSLAIVALAMWIAQGATIRRSCDTRRDELEPLADVDTSALFH
ncbi:hypothetical protein [Paraburkholderia nodosa]|uniref:hypothetical protein n=1 Tax=Paraburkholderia nodosa TaxID=392320 RepID=UPI000480D478|nr:hypothetical protein [Paraburkholderia nodosa]